MITFSQFLSLYNEIITLDNPEIESNISIEEKYGDPFARFTVDGIPFECSLEKQYLSIFPASHNGRIIQKYIELVQNQTESPNTNQQNLSPFGYEITLSNQSPENRFGSFDLKNLYGYKAIKIYNYMVISIKKLINQIETKGDPVNIISYSAYATNTEPLYDKLFKKFLSEKYIRVSRNSIMKKEIYNMLAHEDEEIKNYQQNVQLKHQDILNFAKSMQNQDREARR